jgi:hypothetical protein
MADVDGPPRRRRDADRAQLFLVGGLALAVIFIVLAVLLNTAIYTGNIATRDPGPGSGEIMEYERAATSMANHTIVAVNEENNSSYSALRSSFRGTVTDWSDAAAVHSSMRLVDAHVSTSTTQRGTKIGQDNRDDFTDDNGNDDWTVANNTTARAFRMNVSQPSLVDITSALGLTDSFYVGFDNGTSEWKAYVYQEGGTNVSVDVEDPSGTQIGDTCTADAGTNNHVVIQLSTAQVGDQSCPAFTQLFRNVSDPYTVTYNNTESATDDERINGTYSVVVDRPTDDLATGADDSSGEPYAAPALYSADLQVTYRSPSVFYRTEIRVAPEETDG